MRAFKKNVTSINKKKWKDSSQVRYLFPFSFLHKSLFVSINYRNQISTSPFPFVYFSTETTAFNITNRPSVWPLNDSVLTFLNYLLGPWGGVVVKALL